MCGMGERASPSDAVVRFLDQNVPMLILADVGNVVGAARERLDKWIEDGGVLVRFAGPRLAASDDDLVPVRLRRGGRTLGGSPDAGKSRSRWRAFSREGPFGGMPVPGDVTVNRQVLAEPEAGLSERTWATLADGTPLVTGAAPRQGHDRSVPCHRRYTLVGSAAVRRPFVDMLKRLVALAGTTATRRAGNARRATARRWPPARVLRRLRRLHRAARRARKPVPANYTTRATADYPPGFYGPPEGLLAGTH